MFWSRFFCLPLSRTHSLWQVWLKVHLFRVAFICLASLKAPLISVVGIVLYILSKLIRFSKTDCWLTRALVSCTFTWVDPNRCRSFLLRPVACSMPLNEHCRSTAYDHGISWGPPGTGLPIFDPRQPVSSHPAKALSENANRHFIVYKTKMNQEE